MQGSCLVGRVGGLAVALGIGVGAVWAGAGCAQASPEDSSRISTDARTDSSRPASDSRGRPRTTRHSGPTPAASVVGHPARRAAGLPRGVAAAGADRKAPGRLSARQTVRVSATTLPKMIAAASAATSAGLGKLPVPAAVASVSALSSAPNVAVSVAPPVMTLPPGRVAASAASVVASARRQPGIPVAPSAAAVSNAQALPARRILSWLAGLFRRPRSTNQAPVIATVTLGTANATTGAVTGTVTASDPNGDALSYSAMTSAKGVVSIDSAGLFTYTPTATARHDSAKIGAATSATTDTVTVVVTDAKGASTSKAVTVTILPKNAVPVAGTTTVGTPNATTGVVTGTVTATDADQDALSYSAPGTTSKGSVSVNAGTGAFTYTPAGTTTGTDTFTVTVTDGYGGSVPVSVSVPVAAVTSPPAKISFVFNYGSGARFWSDEAKAALQDSADALAAYFVISAPVTLVFDVSAVRSPFSSTLASTGSDLVSNGAGFFNTVVQNKVLTGIDSNGSAADGSIEVNFGNPWAYGDSVSNSQYDFKSTMMHEMLHAYGFLAYVDEAGWNTGTNWTKFDSFIVTRADTKVINPSTYRFNTAYNTNLTGGAGGLFFGGENAVAAYGGLVPLYTPRPWEPGSSVSHLDDSTFTGVNAKLMNAIADTGLSARTLSTVELGILKDIGYTVKSSPAASALLFIGLVFFRRRKPNELIGKYQAAERD